MICVLHRAILFEGHKGVGYERWNIPKKKKITLKSHSWFTCRNALLSAITDDIGV